MARFRPVCTNCQEVRTDHRSGICRECRQSHCDHCAVVFVKQDRFETTCSSCQKTRTLLKRARFFEEPQSSLSEASLRGLGVL